jgi:hypothetical protein
MKYSTSTLGMLALSALVTTAFVACGDPDPNTTASTSTGAGGGSTSATASTGTGSGLTPEAQAAKFCDDITPPYCEALFACCTDAMKLMSAGGTVEGCKTKFAADCATQIAGPILEQVKAGATALDEARLATCVTRLDGMKSGSAACTEPPTLLLEFECVAAFQGTIAPGGTCDSTNLHDDEYIVCKDGVCDNGKCKAFLATGAACDPSQNSMAAAGCNYANSELCVGTGTTGKCGAAGEIGAACELADQDKSFDCKSRSCGPNKTCIAPTAYGLCTSG